jgi:hypothetical protein
MDEVGPVAINGLTVKGVTFHDTAAATYDTSNGGQLRYTQDPVIEGNNTGAEIVLMDFAFPVYSVKFGLALSTFANVYSAASVTLYDTSLNPIATYNIMTATDCCAGAPFSNGYFSKYSPIAIGRVVVNLTLDPAQGATAFGLDNLELNSLLPVMESSWFGWYTTQMGNRTI